MDNQKTIFTADIHLSSRKGRKNALFKSFIDMVIEQKGNLFILGDLFDFWANNSIVIKDNESVLEKLREISLSGFRTGFVFGNRDYLINPKTLSDFGVMYMGEEAEIELCKKKVFLAHGHTLCLSDTKFISYKKKVWPVLNILDKILPGPVENLIALMMIKKSKKTIQSQSPSRFEFTTTEIDRLFKRGIDFIVCGHRHQKQVYENGEKRLYALPEWKDSKGNYLLHQNGEFYYHEFS